MIKFYDHPKTGILHFRASAGGGQGLASVFDAPATKADIAKHAVEHNEYLELKKHGVAELAKSPNDLEARNLFIADLQGQLAAARAEIERLNLELARRSVA